MFGAPPGRPGGGGIGLPDCERGGPGGGGIGFPERDVGPAGASGGVFFGSASIAGRGFDSPLEAPSGFAGFSAFGVAVGGGATGPSGTTRRESFDETILLGIAKSGSSFASTTFGVDPGTVSVAAATSSICSGSGLGTGSGSGVGSGSAATSTGGGVAAAFFSGAFFFAGGFLVETGGVFSAFASGSGFSSSSGGVSRTRPSRSALRRTRSAWASTMLDE